MNKWTLPNPNWHSDMQLWRRFPWRSLSLSLYFSFSLRHRISHQKNMRNACTFRNDINNMEPEDMAFEHQTHITYTYIQRVVGATFKRGSRMVSFFLARVIVWVTCGRIFRNLICCKTASSSLQKGECSKPSKYNGVGVWTLNNE